MNLQIAYNDKDRFYFIYDDGKERWPIVFAGSYTQCLIVIGGVNQNLELDAAIRLAKGVYNHRKSSKFQKANIERLVKENQS